MHTYINGSFFLWKSDCLGSAVLLCLVVCLTLLASFFLPSAYTQTHRAVPRIVPFTCRQCPGYMGTRLHPPHAPPPPFTCTLSTNHVLCMCCLQPMPDRRLDTDIRVPPQKCEVFFQKFFLYVLCRCVYVQVHVYTLYVCFNER